MAIPLIGIKKQLD